MLATRITTHVDDAKSRLVEQYRTRPLLLGLVDALVTPLQALEDATFQVDSGRLLANATGIQLDKIGELVGVSRGSLVDSDYKALILGTIGVNYSDTTAETLLNITRSLFQTTRVFIQTPNSPGQTLGPGRAWVGIAVGSSPALGQLTILQRSLSASLGAGIALAYIATFNAQGAFATAGNQPWVRGCSDLNAPNAATDGQLGSVVFTDTRV